MIVCVYDDYGSSQFSTDELVMCMKTTFSNDEVKRVKATQIKDGILNDAKFLCIGGGFDKGYMVALGQDGCSAIQKFIKSGGYYIGICAGAYFAADSIEFDLNGPLEVKGERFLKLFRGKCIGPMNNFEYNNENGAVAVELDIPSYPDGYFAYLNGGGYFEGHEENYEIVAKYKSNSKPSIIKGKFGSGDVLLSGVHIEFNPNHLDLQNDNIALNVQPKITDRNEQVYRLMRQLISI
jgi:glutamine amidotransferase-like uncharacterized protein